MYIKDANGNVIIDALGKKWWLDNYLKENFDFIIPRVVHKVPHRRSDMFIICDGAVGSGKTTLSFQVAKYFDDTFDLSRVVFNVDDFLEALIKATPGQAIVFDEAIVVNSRSALTEFNKKVMIAMTQIRSKGLYMIFNIPSIFDLDRTLVLNRCQILLHCYQNGFGNRGNYLVFNDDNMKRLYLKGKKLYSYSYPKANFKGRFTEFFPLNRVEYENKKQTEIIKQAKGKKGNVCMLERNELIKLMVKEMWVGQPVVKKCENISEVCKTLSPSRVRDIVYGKVFKEQEDLFKF